MKETLFYRTAGHNGGLVFAPEGEARRVAQIHRAINKARTWAEFRSLMPRADYSEIMAWFDRWGEGRPRGKDKFSGEGVAGWSDGDYPTWLQQTMDYVIPDEILREFGELSHTHFNGSYWHLPPEREREIVAALRARGFVVRKQSKLGFW